MLRIDLEDFEGNITHAEYTSFKVADKADKYRLLIGGYNGTAGDSTTLHRMQFSTNDYDNDVHSIHQCSKQFRGAG